VVACIDRVCRLFPRFPRPHVHVDAAVGWVGSVLLDYDCSWNPLGFSLAALASIERVQHRFQGLRSADSVTLDLHKWGLVSYPSSCVVFRERQALEQFAADRSLFSYFEHKEQDNPLPPVLSKGVHIAVDQSTARTGLHDPLHGSSFPRVTNHSLHELTIECSRSAVGVYSALMHLQSVGLVGLQLMAGTSLQNAAYARDAIRLHPQFGERSFVVPSNGPSFAWRLLPPSTQCSHEEEMQRALQALESVEDVPDELVATRPAVQEMASTISERSHYHRQVYDARGGGRTGLRTAWVGQATHTPATGRRHRRFDIPGEKLVFFHPGTTFEHIDHYVSAVAEAENSMN
jgi:L-2,4-diaminobutyrate decarboxylase